jgi:hypothetical protein
VQFDIQLPEKLTLEDQTATLPVTITMGNVRLVSDIKWALGWYAHKIANLYCRIEETES